MMNGFQRFINWFSSVAKNGSNYAFIQNSFQYYYGWTIVVVKFITGITKQFPKV